MLRAFGERMAWLGIGLLIGGAIAAQAMARVASGSPVFDDFNRANSETVGNNWEDTGSDAWDINSNQLRHDTATTDVILHSQVISSGWEDYVWQWTVPASGVATFFVFRSDNSASNFYQFGVNAVGQWKLFKPPGFIEIFSLDGAPTSGTQYYKLSVRGEHITMYYSNASNNGWRVLGQVYDFDHARTSGKFGFRGNSNGWTIDNVWYREPGITIKGAALDGILAGWQGFQDAFDRADSETVGGFWTDTGSDSYRILSGKLYKDNTVNETLVTDSSTDLTDQVATFAFTFNNSSEKINAMIRRVTSPSLAFYQIEINQSGSMALWYYNGSFNSVRSTTVTAFTVGAQYEAMFSAVGSTIKFSYGQYAGRPWTQLFEWTDPNNISTHGVFGFRDTGVVTFDHFQFVPIPLAMNWTPEYQPDNIRRGPTLTNAGFESCTVTNDDPPKWLNNSAANTGCQTGGSLQRTGSWNAYVNTSTASMMSQGFWATPGYTYTASVWARRNTGSGNLGYGSVSTLANGGGSTLCTTGFSSTTTYTELTCNFTVSYTGVFFLNLRINAAARSEFDDISISSSSDDRGPNAYAPSIVEYAGSWRRYFGRGASTSTTVNDKIWMQTSTDTRTWGSASIVFSPAASTAWDDYEVNDPSTVVVGGTLYLYYSATPQSNPVQCQIGLATSTDGVNFTRHPSNPVITVGAGGTWNDEAICRPAVLYDGGTWKMWADGADPNPRGIGYWTSTDGVSWTPNGGNPIYEPAFPAAAVAVQKYDSTYYLFNQEAQRGTWYATSTDGISWTSQSMLLAPVTEFLYTFAIYTPEFFKIGSSQRLYQGGTFDFDDGTGYDATFNLNSMALWQLYKRVTAFAGSKRVAGRTWVVNDNDVKVELDEVGSLTINLHTNMDDDSAVLSTVSLSDVNWGDTFAGSAFPFPALWWEFYR